MLDRTRWWWTVLSLTIVVILCGVAPINASAYDGHSPPPLLAWSIVEWWQDVTNWFNQQGSSRSRMLTVGIFGLALAMYIMHRASQKPK
jgi:uncharacterized membrane protein HdeD (DUF308 family)